LLSVIRKYRHFPFDMVCYLLALMTSLLATRRFSSFVLVKQSTNVPPCYNSHYTRASQLFSTTQTTSSSIFDTSDRRVRKLGELLNDVRGIIRTPGMTKDSIIRSIQIARALNRITLDYINDRTLFLTPSGQISIPKTLKRVFEEFGATYIKLGQFIASSPTLFPAEFVTEFQTCLDNSPTVSYSVIRQIIQDDLQRPISAVFSRVDPVPLASASIAQVHRATLLDGTEVVVKVRKPGVDSTLQADLSFLLISTKIIEFINPALSSLSLSNIVTDIRDSMLDELDFRKEIENIINFRDFLKNNNIMDATAPIPYPAASSKRVLTMEYLDGVPLADLEGIRKFTASPEATLVSALRTWALSVAVNDKFHADVHAGNLLVLEDGRIGFIDFGIVGKISNSFRTSIGDLFDSFVKDDFKGVAKALVKMGATDVKIDTDKFGNDLAEVVNRIMSLEPQIAITTDEVGQTIDARLEVDERETTQLVLEIVNVAEKNGLKLPREFGLILKQALYFDRYQKLLAPSMDPLRDSRLRDSFNQQILTPPKGGRKNIIIDTEIVSE